MANETEQSFTGMYDFLEALEAVIKAADPEKRDALADVIDAYAESDPGEFYWAVSAQAPTLLYQMMMSIDSSCRPEAQSKPRPPIRLVGRKHQPNE